MITFDGPNGSGKTTIIEKLVKSLEKNYSIKTTKEPSSTNLGAYVLKNEELLFGKTYAHLIAADRSHHIETEIIPFLKKCDIVLCDRYVESSMVLQRFDGVVMKYIWKLNSDFIIPDLSVILLASPEELDNRLSKRTSKSRFENEMSRAMEIDYYKDAGDFLRKKGYNILYINNSEGSYDANSKKILDEIIKLVRKVK